MVTAESRLPFTLPGMDTCGSADRAAMRRRQINWAAAFASGDPARQWAAASSVALVVTAADAWVDSTAVHEATCGAYDAVLDRCGLDAVAAALLGARRALHWERHARFRIVPPSSMAEHRWEADRSCQSGPGGVIDYLELWQDVPDVGQPEPRPESTVARWAGNDLRDAGWDFPVEPVAAVEDAIEVVADGDRDRATAALLALHPQLPRVVACDLTLLVAGSRRRDGMAWPGIVWLDAHYGAAAAAANDRGTRSVIRAAVEQRRGRPVGSMRRRNVTPAGPSRLPRQGAGRSHTKEAVGRDAGMAVAS